VHGAAENTSLTGLLDPGDRTFTAHVGFEGDRFAERLAGANLADGCDAAG
jgi:hypothetical protein